MSAGAVIEDLKQQQVAIAEEASARATTIDGADLLDRVEAYLHRFVAYPSEAAQIAHVLWCAHAHRMDVWDSTPRIAFLSPEPGSGKSRALEVTELLVPRPVHAVNTTPAYLFRKVSDEAGAPTLLYDEIDTVFGPKAKDNEDIRGMLNAGHRKGATAGRCVVHGKRVETEELPAYCAVALAGLNNLPDTLASRSVLVRMRRRAPSERVEPFRYREQVAEGHALRDELSLWTLVIPDTVWPVMPAQITDRNADVWEALFAVADAAGGHWAERARRAAVTLVTDVTAESGGSLGIQLLTDLRVVFDASDRDKISTAILLEELIAMEESPWATLRGKPLDPRGLSSRLSVYGIKSRTIRDGGETAKGYHRTDFADAWARYVTDREGQLSHSSRGSEGGADDLGALSGWRSDLPSDSAVTSVTASLDGSCPICLAPPPRMGSFGLIACKHQLAESEGEGRPESLPREACLLA